MRRLRPARLHVPNAVLPTGPTLTLSCFGENYILATEVDQAQLTRLVDEAPAGDGWLHEIKYDGYRTHARIDGGDISSLPEPGWTGRIDTPARSRRCTN
jgi:hypothetical protein